MVRVYTMRRETIRIISVRRAREEEAGPMSGTKTIGRDITAEEFDRKFDNGEDVSDYVDWSTAKQPNLETRRVNVDFPAWVVAGLDRQAKRLGVTRQALIKMWIAEKVS